MTIADLVAMNKPVLFDGANGTEYQKRGLAPEVPPEFWNLDRPSAVKDVHKDYVLAGSQVIGTNTFGGNRSRLREAGLEDKIKAINKAAIELAFSAAEGRAIVAGSVGPLGALIEPFGEISQQEARDQFGEQIRLLVDGGVQFVIIETMMSLEEAVLALTTAREAGAGAVAVTMTFEPTKQGPRTAFGETPGQVAKVLVQNGALMVGSNCGCALDVMKDVAREMKSATAAPILIQPNSGLPTVGADGIVYPETPRRYAELVQDLIGWGIKGIGGCCGTTPQYIAAAHRILEKKSAVE